MGIVVIEGDHARSMTAGEKWRLLSPYLQAFGGCSVSYATLQPGMEYFILDAVGYLAYVSIKHPVFACTGMKFCLGDPVCHREDYPRLMAAFLDHCKHAGFGPIGLEFAECLRELGFKINCVGYDPVIPVQTYNTQGNWKELDNIRRARNEARKKRVAIREATDLDAIPTGDLARVSECWLQGKVLKDREIWIYARKPVYGNEPDVRKFIAYDGNGRMIGFSFYDPIYRAGSVVGYSANTCRCDETNFNKLSIAMHMEATEAFKAEGKEFINLCMAPFDKIDKGKYQDDWTTRHFFKLSRKYGEGIYNFSGLSFLKSKYRAEEIPVYFASNGAFPSNDVYLTFRSAHISTGFFATLGKLAGGIAAGLFVPFGTALKTSPRRAERHPHGISN